MTDYPSVKIYMFENLLLTYFYLAIIHSLDKETISSLFLHI